MNNKTEEKKRPAYPGFSLIFDKKPFYSENSPFEEKDGGRVFYPGGGVEITQIIREYPDFDAVEWTLYFKNTSQKNSPVLEKINDCDAVIPLPDDAPLQKGFLPGEDQAHVISFSGAVEGKYYSENDEMSATEFSRKKDYLNRARHYENAGGRSSNAMMPFFIAENSHSGAYIAVGWTGDWRADFERVPGGARVRTGLKNAAFYLLPGEEVRTGSVLVIRYKKGECAHNKFRALIRKHFSHAACAKSGEKLLAAELWGGLPSGEMKRRIRLFRDHEVNFEQFWIDAGWYGRCADCRDPYTGDWSRRTGEWQVNERVHPALLDDVAEETSLSGAGLMLWIEPERAVEGVPILKEHPEYFLRKKLPDGSTDPTAILNLGRDDALDYALGVVGGAVERYSLSCYRQDFNTSLTEFFFQNDEPDRRGITEIKHITGLYKFWDELLKRFPGLFIDNCASGGRRIDIETLRRSLIFFRSDYQCGFDAEPDVVQTHNTNVSALLPYTGCTTKIKSDDYAARSSFSSSWGAAFFNAVFQTMEEKDFEWAKKTVGEYLQIRKFFSKDFYNHGTERFDKTAWTIWQYHDPENSKGVVMAFRRSASPHPSAEITLEGVKENAKVSFFDFDTHSAYEGTRDLTLTLPAKRSSAVITYEVK
ncbi:MAG: alpha-galactosidase [Clostridia bacterium]|nr:alpha-galactosidase [Clostridia bacterium]